ncbi:MAG: hypothetical protein C0478_03520, partial [Planctomyces sp.]|nr:hypothetical protein [Planctomyces sp.]
MKPCTQVYVLIPSHSLEDFPQDLGEEAAASLLEAFALAWHPALVASTGRIPQWYRADSPPEPALGQLLILPQPSEDWFPYDWPERLEKAGAMLLRTVAPRDENLRLLKDLLQSSSDTPSPIDATVSEAVSDSTAEEPGDVQASLGDPIADAVGIDGAPYFEENAREAVADFLALGTTILQLELLSRQMRHFSSLDEIILQQRSVQAARDIVSGDFAKCRDQLASAFENLLETRERFYPNEIALLDLCLVPHDLTSEQLSQAVKDLFRPVTQPLGMRPAVNFLPGSLAESRLLRLANDELQSVTTNEAAPSAEQVAPTTLRSLLAEGAVDVLGGEAVELCSPLLPVDAWLRNWFEGQRLSREALGQAPAVYARRAFGFVPQLPGVLSQTAYVGALHVLLDDGIYPDEEFSNFRWEGCDGAAVTAFSRIPLPAQSAGAFLRLASRMGEALDADGHPAIAFARWPEVQTPWFHDLKRAATFAPVLGKFVTCRSFLEGIVHPDHIRRHPAGEYFSPRLVQAVAAREKDPISRPGQGWKQQRLFDAWQWCQCLSTLLSPSTASEGNNPATLGEGARWSASIEEFFRPHQAITTKSSVVVETTEAAGEMESVWSAEDALQRAGHALAARLGVVAHRVPDSVGGAPAPRSLGTLLFNPAPFARAVPHDLNAGDDAQVPPCGYLWIAKDGAVPSQTERGKRASKPRVTYSEGVLSNEHFEVVFHPETGGIARIRRHDQRENRLSLQIARRFSRERSIKLGPDPDDEVIKTAYSEMRGGELSILAQDEQSITIRSLGDVIDQAKGERICYYTLDVTLRAGSLRAEIDLKLLELAPFDGDPWNNYIAARFAFGNEMAAVSRSVLGSVHGAGSERFEAPEFVEICDGTLRATILPHGRPFFRKTGPRMIDGLMVVSGESARRFAWTIAVDDAHPARLTQEVMSPLVRIPEVIAPSTGNSAFFVQCPARQVMITSWQAGIVPWPLPAAETDPDSTPEAHQTSQAHT